MKVLLAVLIQFAGFASLAHTVSSTMAVTVTVVRPAPVITILPQVDQIGFAPQVSTSESSLGATDLIRIICIEY